MEYLGTEEEALRQAEILWRTSATATQRHLIKAFNTLGARPALVRAFLRSAMLSWPATPLRSAVASVESLWGLGAASYYLAWSYDAAGYFEGALASATRVPKMSDQWVPSLYVAASSELHLGNLHTVTETLETLMGAETGQECVAALREIAGRVGKAPATLLARELDQLRSRADTQDHVGSLSSVAEMASATGAPERFANLALTTRPWQDLYVAFPELTSESESLADSDRRNWEAATKRDPANWLLARPIACYYRCHFDLRVGLLLLRSARAATMLLFQFKLALRRGCGEAFATLGKSEDISE